MHTLVEKHKNENRTLSGKNSKIRGYEQKILVLDDDFDLSNLVKNILQRMFSFGKRVVLNVFTSSKSDKVKDIVWKEVN